MYKDGTGEVTATETADFVDVKDNYYFTLGNN